MRLDALVSRAAVATPDALAVRAPDGDLTYAQLDAMANQVARALSGLGVGPGDRVAILLPKSMQAIATMQGVLRIGAAYVPVDATGPASRAKVVLSDCGVRAVVADADSARSILTDDLRHVPLLTADSISAHSAQPIPPPAEGREALAYILYTSGSTGRPKGVCISHENAMAFVEWAVAAFGAGASDRFANHAPFHFDLSVLDIYGAFAVGAAVYLVPEGTAYAAERLVDFIRSNAITIWYSVPSAIVLMMEHGALLAAPPPSLRTLLFAGESFPMKYLRTLREALPRLAMWNLYGPTETNVCTAHEVCEVADADTSIPIGAAVCGDRVWLRNAEGLEAAPGETGELMVDGPTVFMGYWGKPPQRGPYGTGDLARLGEGGVLWFLGRRDYMVKIRGYRVELGEIDAALLQHPSVREVATLVLGEGIAARLIACVSLAPGTRLTLLDVKRHCAERLPRFMIPDELRSMAALPRNGNGKIDRQKLAEQEDSSTVP